MAENIGLAQILSGITALPRKKDLIVVIYLGFLTESNKPFIRFGVTGPIFKTTTEVTWAGRENTQGKE